MELYSNNKLVTKLWGAETWLHLNEYYCYKRILIKAGYKTSFQYHENKVETNYIISGEAEVWLEDDNGKIQIYMMKEGDYFTVNPPKKHRVIAITDVILQEVSTPHVDDVIRINDEFGRGNGKIESEHQTPTVLILAAGKGTRVQSISRDLHKGLLKINDKAAISHIIDSFPPEFDIIIALGYNGDIVRSYVETAHSNRKITYINVENWSGEKSGPGTSAYACKDYLQKPFYFVTVDCIFNYKPELMHMNNWIGVTKTDLPEIYSTAKINIENEVVEFVNKNKNGFENAFIGLAYIKDYEQFWSALENESEVIAPFIKNFAKTSIKEINYSDIGNIDGYNRLVGQYKQEEKNTKEQSYILDSKFIKLNADRKITTERSNRAKHIDPSLLPQNININDYTLSYDLVDGKTVYEINETSVYKQLIDHVFFTIRSSKYPLYNDKNNNELFYLSKTKKRIQEFYQKNPNIEKYPYLKINGNIYENTIHFNYDRLINKVIFYNNFHGDLQPDNVIYTNDQKFVYIDWRSNFGEYITGGDIYYDLAKLYGGLKFNYKLSKNLDVFKLNHYDNEYNYIVPNTTECNASINHFLDCCTLLGYDIRVIKERTALIWINMSPIHLYPMNIVLYCEGVKLLNENR